MEEGFGELLFRNIPVPVAYLLPVNNPDNVPDGRPVNGQMNFLFRQINPAFEKSLGIDAAEYMDTSIFDFFLKKEADAAGLQKDFAKAALEHAVTVRDVYFGKGDTWH